MEPASLQSQGTILSAAERASGDVCYDTATLLPSVLPLAAAVGASGCQGDVILSPLSTLLVLGSPLGLNQGIITVRQTGSTAPGSRYLTVKQVVSHQGADM